MPSAVMGGSSGGGASYLVYTAYITQTGTDAPVATVLENSLGGALVWSYDDPGQYTATLAGAFPADGKIYFAYSFRAGSGLDSSVLMFLSRASADAVTIHHTDGSIGGGTHLDGLMANVEIRVYP